MRIPVLFTIEFFQDSAPSQALTQADNPLAYDKNDTGKRCLLQEGMLKQNQNLQTIQRLCDYRIVHIF